MFQQIFFFHVFAFVRERTRLKLALIKSLIILQNAPIPKLTKNDPRVPLNYRGVSLLSTVYKLFSNILNSRLSQYLEDENILEEEQNGFRKHKSCLDHIYTLCTVIRARIFEGKSTFVCFIDFQKAFDCVHRDLLEFKLISARVDGLFYNAVKALYKNPVPCVQVNDMRTGWFPTPLGVKQGDVLSPTLFSLFINDLAQQIKNEDIGVNVDDMKLNF